MIVNPHFEVGFLLGAAFGLFIAIIMDATEKTFRKKPVNLGTFHPVSTPESKDIKKELKRLQKSLNITPKKSTRKDKK